MRKFKFFSKIDSNKETISITEAHSYEDALDQFCQMKDLYPKEFLKIFEIEEDGNKNQ